MVNKSQSTEAWWLEKEVSKKKFGDRYSECKSRRGYEQTLQRYITKYEGIEDDEDVAQYFRNLSINKRNDYTPEFVSFYTKSE